jgi:hypothetical protein
MKKLIVFLNKVNEKTDNTLYIMVSVIILSTVSIMMIITGTSVIDLKQEMDIMDYFVVFILTSLANAMMIVLVVVFFILSNMFKNWCKSTTNAFKETLKEDYNIETTDNNKVKFQ